MHCRQPRLQHSQANITRWKQTNITPQQTHARREYKVSNLRLCLSHDQIFQIIRWNEEGSDQILCYCYFLRSWIQYYQRHLKTRSDMANLYGEIVHLGCWCPSSPWPTERQQILHQRVCRRAPKNDSQALSVCQKDNWQSGILHGSCQLHERRSNGKSWVAIDLVQYVQCLALVQATGRQGEVTKREALPHQRSEEGTRKSGVKMRSFEWQSTRPSFMLVSSTRNGSTQRHGDKSYRFYLPDPERMPRK